MRLILCLTIVGIAIPVILAKSTKSVGVSGTVVCDGQPVRNAMIELYPEKYSSMVMATAVSDAKGEFTVSGKLKTDTFNPHFSISHTCRSQLCTRKVVLSIPEKYVTSASKPRELYDIGIVDMKKKYPTETKTCPS